MTRKGGGRESDEVVQGNAPPRQADVGTLSAAANPAARPLLQCPVGLDGAYHSCCQQVRALEAELADVRKWLDATHANQQDLVMERNDAVARAEKAEARVKELERKLKVSLIKQHLFKDDPRVSFRTAEMLMHIALDAPCLCIPNGEACLGHQFIRIWYEEKGALRDADPERVREAEAGVPFRAKNARGDLRGEDRG